MVESKLESLPNELMEWVTLYSSFHDICNIRLVSRTLRSKVTQGTFGSLFRNIHVDVKKHTLESFAKFTESSLSRNIENLTIVGILYHFDTLERLLETGQKFDLVEENSNIREFRDCSSEEIAQAESDLETLQEQESDSAELFTENRGVSLIREAFSNMTGQGRRRLKSLSLEVAIHTESASMKSRPCDCGYTELDQIFRTASATFAMVSSALSGTELRAEQMIIFNTIPESLVCSLPRNELSTFAWKTLAYSEFLSELTSISMSVSERLPTYPDLSEDAVRAMLADETNLSGFKSLLEACPALEELHVSFFRSSIWGWCADEDDPYSHNAHVTMWREQGQQLTRMGFKQLRKLQLGGMIMNSGDLKRFLRAHSNSLRELYLKCFYFEDGGLSSILALISTDLFHFDDITLEDLLDGEEAVRFTKNDELKQTSVGGPFAGRSTIHCWGDDTRRQIGFGYIQGFESNNPTASQGRKALGREFGGRR